MLYPSPITRKALEAILTPLKTNTRAGYTLRKPARKSRRAERIVKIRPDCAPPLYHRMGNVCYILWATFQSWRRAKARRRKPLEAILAPLEKNTRAGYTLRKPARKSCRAERIEKSTAMTVLPHSSIAVSHICYILSAMFLRGPAPERARLRALIGTNAAYEYRQGFIFRDTTGRERGSISPRAIATSDP